MGWWSKIWTDYFSKLLVHRVWKYIWTLLGVVLGVSYLLVRSPAPVPPPPALPEVMIIHVQVTEGGIDVIIERKKGDEKNLSSTGPDAVHIHLPGQ